MRTYVVRRLLLFVPALLGASMLIFVLMRLVPGDVAEILVYQAGSETSGIQQKQIQQIRSELGLDRPVVIQYLSWLGGAVRGDFGKSYAQRRPVWDILTERFPRSMELAILTLAIALIWATVRTRGSTARRLARASTERGSVFSAARYSATASSYAPRRARMLPRLIRERERSGSSRKASR